MDKIRYALQDHVAETLIIPLYSRAREAARPDAMMVDKTAVELVNQIDYDYSRIRFGKQDHVFIIMRLREFDRMARGFLKQNPNAVVVHIGCGLDTRFKRLEDTQAEWYDLDLPEVTRLRKQLGLVDKGKYHSISSSVLDFEWMEKLAVKPSSPILFIAEAVFPYFEESQVKALVLKLREKFPHADLVCDAMTPALIKTDNLHLVLSKMKARLKWGLKHPKDLETWAEGIKLLEEYYYFDRTEPRLGTAQLMRYIPFFAKSTGIFHYKLN
jgi:O-methyltransferase involved in polyketide biosynthesis